MVEWDIDADFFDCDESEELNCETFEAAIGCHFEAYAHHPELPKIIAEQSPVRVTAYKPKEVEDGFLDLLAEDLLVIADERFTEDYGNPNGDDQQVPEDAHEREHDAMVNLLRRFFFGAHVWWSEEVGERTFNAQEVEEILRGCAPEWFEGVRHANS